MTRIHRPALDALEGSTFAERYRLLSLLGSGGMGYVYEAEQLGLGRSVAIKILRGDRIGSSLDRFRAEAMAASRINHPHAVAIYDFGVSSEGVPFLVMEHLRGQPLISLIEDRPLVPSRVIVLGAQVLSAIAEAHACGVVHCDLTSDNVIVERLRDGDDFAKVIDFGLAHAFDLPKGGGIVGTPEYMAPEQIRGSDIGPPADIYAVGVLLYEMIVGRTPFAGTAIPGVINGHLHVLPTAPHEVVPSCLEALGNLILQALDKDPNRRPKSAESMRTQLLSVLGTRQPTSQCSTCGESFAHSSLFCSSCGAEIAPSEPYRKPSASRPAIAPEHAWQAAKPLTRRRTSRLTCQLSPLTALIGRDNEFAKLARFFQGGESANTMTLIGPQGVGKARLVQEVSRQFEQKIPTFLAGCDPSGLKLPWYPILSILEEILGLRATPTLDSLSRAVARCGLPSRDFPGLAEIFALPDGPAQSLELAVRRREAHASALRTLLSAQRRFPNAILCFADFDSYDRPSQDLIHALNIAIGDADLRLIATCMTPESILPGSDTMILDPLSPSQTCQLVAQLANTEATSETSDRETIAVYEVTGGLPARVEQLGGWMQMGNNPDSVPRVVTDLVSLRINRLPASARRVLQAVAIHGTVAPTTLVLHTLGESEPPALPASTWSGLLILEDDYISIPSQLVATLVKESTPAKVRRTLHLRALQALEGKAPRGILGHHAEHCGQRDEAYEHYIKAGHSAVKRFDDHGAAFWYGQALSVARQLQSRGSPHEERKFVRAANHLADVLRCTQQYGLANGILDEAEAFDPEPDQVARIERTRGRIALANGDANSGVGHLRYGIGIAMRIGDRSYLCQTYIELARAIDRLGNTQAAIAELNQAIDVITAGQGLPIAYGPDSLWRVGLQLAERYLRINKTKQAESAALAALEQAQHNTDCGSGRGRLSALLAHIYDSLDDRAAALRYRTKAIEEMRRLGDRQSTAELLIDNATPKTNGSPPRSPEGDKGIQMAARLAAEIGWEEGVHITSISQSAAQMRE